MQKFFEDSIKIGRSIDKRIDKLEKIWETPQIVASGYEKNSEEAVLQVDKLLASIMDVNDQVIADSMPRKTYITDMEQFLQQCESICNDVKRGSEELEAVFYEWGYIGMSMKAEGETSILDPEDMNTTSLECSSQSLDKLSIDSDEDTKAMKNLPKCIATPVIKSVASVLQSEVAATPRHNYPQMPLFSPFFYGNK